MPLFDLHGIVLTTSATHPDEEGEITGLGISKSGKRFFKVEFADRSVEWFSEDQVFAEKK